MKKCIFTWIKLHSCVQFQFKGSIDNKNYSDTFSTLKLILRNKMYEKSKISIKYHCDFHFVEYLKTLNHRFIKHI